MNPRAARSTPTGDPGWASGGTGSSRRGRHAVTGLLVLGILVGVGIAGLVGVGSASVPTGQFQANNSTTGPSLGNLTKVNDTFVALEIVDDTDVDEATITLDDFLLDGGRIANVTATENGTNATAYIELGAPLNRDELTVYVTSDVGIRDTDGNDMVLSSDVALTVDGMDGTPPLVRGFSVGRTEDAQLSVRIETDDPVSFLEVAVSGPEAHQLRLRDFRVSTSPDRYTTTVPVQADGVYEVELVRLRDPHGNRDYLGRTESVRIDHSPPDVVAAVDLGATTGRNYTFDAGRTTDVSPIANVTWTFGDGTTATGERVSHAFAPGNYTVTAHVTDVRGNTGTDDVRVVVGAGNATVGANGSVTAARVRLDSGGANGESAMVQIDGARPNVTVQIPPNAGRVIAGTETVTLESLSVTATRNASYRLGIQATGPAPVRDVAAATGATPIAGLTLVHELPDAAIARANLSLAVSRAAIADAGGNASGLRVYRYHDGAWQGLATAVVASDNETMRYRATAPGLSRFAVAVGGEPATPTATPVEGEGGASETPAATQVAPGTTADDGGSPLAMLPLGLFETLLQVVGGLLTAGFLLLKAIALVMGY